MAIITIARQMGSLGSETATHVARRLDYTLLDQAKLQRAAEDYGMLKSELEEVHERRPTLVTRYLTMRHRAYLDMMQTIIYQYARADDVVILARGATVLLSDVPSALHVNVFAPYERRVRSSWHVKASPDPSLNKWCGRATRIGRVTCDIFSTRTGWTHCSTMS